MSIDAMKILKRLDPEAIRQEMETIDARRAILEEALAFAERVQSLAGKTGGGKRGKLPDRIAAWLKTNGPAMPRTIAEAIDSTGPSVGTVMRKDPKRFKRTKRGWEVR